MKKIILLTFFLMTYITKGMTQDKNIAAVPTYVKVPTGYLMVLREGADVLASLEQLAIKENIPSANYTGMGFVNVKFGFFNFKTKGYEPKEFNDVELASMTGSIAWQGNKVSLHTHGVVTDVSRNSHLARMCCS